MNKHILIINLGSPQSLEISDIKSYLNEFLSDPLVIDLPKPIQQIILKFFILPFRTKKTRSAYKSIWTPEGSPLIYNTKTIANALSKKTGWNVEYAMRYKHPSIEEKILRYKINKVNKLIIIPLYPHNAISTTLSTKRFINKTINKIYPQLKSIITKPFYNNPFYIKALSKSIKPYLNKIDKLVFSYHGIPERHIRKGDLSNSHCLKSKNCCEINCYASNNCYKSNVITTSKLCAQYLNLEPNQWMVSFQSRVTIIDSKWLKPYTDFELIKLPKQGIKNIGVVCPSFVADCLETLEEIKIRGEKDFIKAGGKKLYFIPCLNDNQNFIFALENIVLNTHN